MIILGLCVLGLAMGSFVNALVWRLHEQSKPKKKRVAGDRELSITAGRSMCPNCRHTLQWYDLLPVISWISLGGKCRYCHKPISWQYPLVELMTAGLFVLSYVYWPLNFEIGQTLLFAIWLILLTGFISLTIYDLRWMILPNRIVFPLQALTIFYLLIEIAVSPGLAWTIVQNALLAVVCSAGLFYVLFQMSKGEWIGGGDVKLAVILGLLLGTPLNAFAMLFLASLLGSCVAIPLIILKKYKRQTKLPFGPFLIMATVVIYLFGAALISWYKRQFLFV